MQWFNLGATVQRRVLLPLSSKPSPWWRDTVKEGRGPNEVRSRDQMGAEVHQGIAAVWVGDCKCKCRGELPLSSKALPWWHGVSNVPEEKGVPGVCVHKCSIGRCLQGPQMQPGCLPPQSRESLRWQEEAPLTLHTAKILNQFKLRYWTNPNNIRQHIIHSQGRNDERRRESQWCFCMVCRN